MSTGVVVATLWSQFCHPRSLLHSISHSWFFLPLPAMFLDVSHIFIMMTLVANLFKSSLPLSLFFKPLLLLLLLYFVTKISNYEENHCNYFLISLFIRLLLAKPIMIAPSGAELDGEVLRSPMISIVDQSIMIPLSHHQT